MLPQKIFGLFYMYGLMIAVGILCCFFLLFIFGKKKKVEDRFVDFIFYNGIVAIILGFGSAALFQATYNYIENPEKGFHFNGGITFIGGLIGGVVSFLVGYFIFRKKFKTRLVDVVSFLPCCILVAHAFGRLGCFFAGCCYGSPTDSFLGVTFAPGSAPAKRYPGIDGRSIPLHPTQLYESIFLFALFAVCMLLYWKKDFKHNLSLYLICYGVFRFCLEFLRNDHRGELLGGITPSQFWSICMVVIGIGLIFLMNWLLKRRKVELCFVHALDGEKVANIQAKDIQEEKTEVE